MTIDLDKLLHGKPTWQQVVDYWKDGEFYEEGYQVEAIKKHLRTEEQRVTMFLHDLSIEDILNGRYTTSGKQGKAVNKILKEWNAKLGFKSFLEW